MTENPYAIRVDELVGSVRVPIAEQVVEQPAQRASTGDPSTGPFPGDGLCGDADGE